RTAPARSATARAAARPMSHSGGPDDAPNPRKPKGCCSDDRGGQRLMAEKGPRVEVVRGRRVETVEFGLRTAKDNIFHRKGHVEQMPSVEQAVDCRARPFCGWKGDEQIVPRTIVTYTTDWTVVPGHEGSQHLSCHPPDTPQGRPSDNMFAQGPD